VVTNPPFSLFREYVAQLQEYDKKYVIIGNQNAITYKETFNLIKEEKLWLGHSIHSGDREFRVPDSYPLNATGSRIDIG
jgi:Adenine-specific methyltransferase EcoRI